MTPDPSALAKLQAKFDAQQAKEGQEKAGDPTKATGSTNIPKEVHTMDILASCPEEGNSETEEKDSDVPTVHLITGSKPFTKRYFLADGAITSDVENYHQSVVSSESVTFENAEDLKEVILAAQKKGSALATGPLAKPLVNESRAGMIKKDGPAPFGLLDVDRGEYTGAPLMSMSEVIGSLGLLGYAHVLQWSASFGIVGKPAELKAHVFFPFDGEVKLSEWRRYLRWKALTVPSLKKQFTAMTGESPDGPIINGLNYPLDLDATDGNRLISVSAPILEGVECTLKESERVQVVKGKPIPAAMIKEAISDKELAKLELEIRTALAKEVKGKVGSVKLFEGQKLADAPGEMPISNPVEDSLRVNFDLNGKWGRRSYYIHLDAIHSEEGPIIYNRRGDSLYLLKDVNPDFLAKLREAHPQSEEDKVFEKAWQEGKAWGKALVKKLNAIVEAKQAGAHANKEALQSEDTEVRQWTLSEMLEEAVLLRDGVRVGLLSDPRYCYPLEDFKKATSSSFEMVPRPDGRLTKTLIATQWQDHPERMEAHSRTFAPGQPIFCKDPSGQPCLNMWRPLSTDKPEDWEARVGPFIEHVAFLVPVEEERERFLNWLAHMIQHPEERPTTHYAMFTRKAQGVGRGLLGAILSGVVAPYSWQNADFVKMMDSGFNGDASGKLFAVVEEIHAEQSRMDKKNFMERAKSEFTATVRHVNPKYGRQYTEHCALRWLLCSNHPDPIYLTEEDRRVIVIENPSKPREKAYYEALGKMKDDPRAIAGIRHWLAIRDISAFNPFEHAPMNSAKLEVVQNCTSDEEQEAQDIVTSWKADLILSEDLRHVLGGVTPAIAQRVAKDAGMVHSPLQVSFGGKQRRYWIVRNATKWKALASKGLTDKVKEEIRLGRGALADHEGLYLLPEAGE